MDSRFDALATDPWAQVFQVVFFPDRIYHAQYLNATRSSRYRYNVQEVRGKADINALKGEVYFDGERLCNFLRIEYRAARLVEVMREKTRFLSYSVVMDITVEPERDNQAHAQVFLDFCPWIDAYQVELWETLEPPHGKRHDYQVLSMMGHKGAITVVPQFEEVLAKIGDLQRINLFFSENPVEKPTGRTIPNDKRAVDDFFRRNVQVPNTTDPSNFQNNKEERSYGVNFQRGWFFENVSNVNPVRYRNAMMNEGKTTPAGDDNIVEMRWILQQEFGGSVVFFHEVTVPPNVVEGTHQHIGSEELYYVVEGKGFAYLGEDDDPQLANAPLEERDIYGIGPKNCRKVEVGPGSVIFTKSGGIHGIENSGATPLKFVAFLYHSA